MSNSVEMTLQGLRKPSEMMTFSFMRNPPVSVTNIQSESKAELRFQTRRAVTFKGGSWRVLKRFNQNYAGQPDLKGTTKVSYVKNI